METLTDGVLHDPEIIALVEKVELIFEPEYEALRPSRNPARIRLEFKDGKEISEEVMNARGDPLDPLSEQEIIDKFFKLTEPVVGRETPRKIVDMIYGLEQGVRVRNMLSLLRTH